MVTSQISFLFLKCRLSAWVTWVRHCPVAGHLAESLITYLKTFRRLPLCGAEVRAMYRKTDVGAVADVLLDLSLTAGGTGVGRGWDGFEGVGSKRVEISIQKSAYIFERIFDRAAALNVKKRFRRTAYQYYLWIRKSDERTEAYK